MERGRLYLYSLPSPHTVKAMKNSILLVFILLLSGCITSNSKNGQLLYSAKCQQSPTECLDQAHSTCDVGEGGAFKTTYSDSHAGTAINDSTPGSVVWYNLRYQCSINFGSPPVFPWRGTPLVIQPEAAPENSTNHTPQF